MKITNLLCMLATAALGVSALAQPVISGVENNYSYVLPGLPNYGIAQGSIFVIFGTNLAATPTGLQSVPLTTSLNNVSVKVTVGGTSEQAILYYVTATQIAGILPSATPAGSGTITVTSNGQTSATAPITVVQSAFGILTMNGAGSGAAAAYDVNYNFVSASNAVNPGEYITLWGTGAGPVPAGTDETHFQPQPLNLPNVPIEVDVSGVSANVSYHGRSQFPGLDQIDVQIPAGVSGCNVSVVVRSGNYVSNFASIAVAASGRTCSDPGLGISQSQLPIPTGQGTFRAGAISVEHYVEYTPALSFGGFTTPASTTTIDLGDASFLQFTPTQLTGYVSSLNTLTIGSCSVTTFSSNTQVNPNPSPLGNLPQITYLDAGPVINMSVNSTKFQLPKSTQTIQGTTYISYETPPQTTFFPNGQATFNFDNGTGGPDVKAFTAQIAVTPIVWTELTTMSTVTRSQGVTVDWTGGNPGSYVTIDGGSFSLSSDGKTYTYAEFSCTAPQSAGHFTVPAAVLLVLPPSSTQTIDGISIPSYGSLSVSNYTGYQSFTSNLDFGIILGITSEASGGITYQ